MSQPVPPAQRWPAASPRADSSRPLTEITATNMADNDELESFRRQWRAEVACRATTAPTADRSSALKFKPDPAQAPPTRHAASLPQRVLDGRDDGGVGGTGTLAFDSPLETRMGGLSIGDADAGRRPEGPPVRTPQSALEHFEEAVKKESEGQLGSSLNLYRRAYRLDEKVDLEYRKKHFPGKPPAPTSNAPPVAPPNVPQVSTPDLIASFATAPIYPAEPLIEGDLPPPCPLAQVPSEILTAILEHAALTDPASLARLALACRRLAFHVATEQSIWRLLCQSAHFGFNSMCYNWACDIDGRRLYRLEEPQPLFPANTNNADLPRPLSSWRQVYHAFPRIRFTGIYISTVNYNRPGAHDDMHSVSWGAPIHIVTYYRYLRFYSDGTVLSLLSTTSPVDIVPHLSRENVATIRTAAKHDPHAIVSGHMSPLAANTLKSVHVGRWHLRDPRPPPEPTNPELDKALYPDPASVPFSSPPPSTHDAAARTAIENDPRDLFIETEGVGRKYNYTLHLALRSASRGAAGGVAPRNTKLMWRGFWSYNRLTDDWAEFGLRNDRAFVFSRVRGW